MQAGRCRFEPGRLQRGLSAGGSSEIDERMGRSSVGRAVARRGFESRRPFSLGEFPGFPVGSVNAARWLLQINNRGSITQYANDMPVVHGVTKAPVAHLDGDQSAGPRPRCAHHVENNPHPRLDLRRARSTDSQHLVSTPMRVRRLWEG